ncbi:hypothetical protein DXV75_03815 [Alteromonas aestuariivivens]|uniref:Uncharacterized protein n=1 Tax=Alteromonas aestuariivivens TaxID=1938339 RepID=A0A3D8MCI0_9ALTE|nr:hypothetical protein [Alteromonas aestuariivivens]RDV28101.1 hypothetical protein DXV75_03815 [Alteromonas aestuariivivens]
MKTRYLAVALSLLLAQPSLAADSVEHSGQASKHSVLASAEGLASGAVVASAVAATPVILSVGAGMAVQSVSTELHESMEGKDHPDVLVITDMVITADEAPDEAIQSQTQWQE